MLSLTKSSLLFGSTKHMTSSSLSMSMIEIESLIDEFLSPPLSDGKKFNFIGITFTGLDWFAMQEFPLLFTVE